MAEASGKIDYEARIAELTKDSFIKEGKIQALEEMVHKLQDDVKQMNYLEA